MDQGVIHSGATPSPGSRPSSGGTLAHLPDLPTVVPSAVTETRSTTERSSSCTRRNITYDGYKHFAEFDSIVDLWQRALLIRSR
jgi:hypothetical protein